jgi:hypothetical protein
MRFRSFVLLLFWIVVLGYAGYGLVSAGAVYFQVRALTEQAFDDAASRQKRTGAAADAATPEFVADVRSGILLGAQRAGLPIDSRNLTVVSERSAIRVALHWSQPVITYGSETILAIPLWLDRSFDLRPSRAAG